MEISLDEVLKSSRGFDKNTVKHTPLEYDYFLSQKYEANIYIKREDLQFVRSYKIRGAYNFISHLDEDQKQKGVVAVSAGNHAQGVAISCFNLGVKGVIFMPQTTPSQKIRKTKKFGGDFIEVKLVGDSVDETFEEAFKYCNENGSVFVHPFDDIQVLKGQATVGLEISEDFQGGDIDYVLSPIGGGGLISGIGSVMKQVSKSTNIIGVESKGSASMYNAFDKGEAVSLDKVEKFVDGAAVKKPGKNSFRIAKEVVDDIKLVDDGLTATVMLDFLDDKGIILEPAGALSIAGLEKIKDKIKGKNVVCVASGGNFDFSRLKEVEEKSLRYLGLKRYFIVSFPQRPGALQDFLSVLGKNDDIVYFEYIKKNSKERGPALVGIESDKKENFEYIMQTMDDKNIPFEDITNKDIYFDLLI